MSVRILEVAPRNKGLIGTKINVSVRIIVSLLKHLSF